MQTLLKDIFELSTKKLESANLSEGILEAVRLAGDATQNYLRSKNLEVSFAYTFFYHDVSYIARYGSKVKIIVFGPPKEVEITFDSGSGPVKEGQIILAATEKFLEKYDVNVFRQEAEIDLEEIIDGLATEISGEKDQSEIGAAFILAKKETETKEAGVEQEISVETESAVGDIEVEDKHAASMRTPIIKFDKLTSLTSSFLKALFGELKKLKRGDIGAIFRLRRNIALAIGVIVLILIISVAFTIRQKIQKEKLGKFNLHLSQASGKYSEAQALLELNRSKAREILSEADKEIKMALSINASEEKANNLQVDITSKLKETENLANVNFSVLFEADSPINSLAFSNKKLVAFSKDKILIGSSKEDLSKIDGVKNTTSGFVFSDSAFLLSGAKVFKVDLKTDKIQELFNFEGAGDISVFLGNIYLSAGSQIAKFVPVENGYIKSSDYLTEKTEFSASSRLAIDGSVWVTSDSKVFKFLRGTKQDFEISGLSGATGQLESIYTNSTLGNIYVIDKTNSALLVLGKDGVYQKAYQSPEFAKASDVVVTDDESTMYLAIENKILEASLK